MNGYIPKQPKQIKERIEAKLDARLGVSVVSRLKPPVALEADRSDHRWWEGVTWGLRNTSSG